MTIARRAASTAPVAVAIATLVAGCLPAPKTQEAEAVSTLWTQFVIAAAVVGGLVWGLITIAIVRFRRRPRDAGTVPPQIGHATWLEAVWTAFPILTILVLFGLTLGALGKVDARAQAATRVTVNVVAYRWQWRFDYPDSGVTVSGGADQPAEMVVPAGEPIHLALTSADVAHAFFVPAFLFKRDAIPGRTNEFDVTITEPGSYGGQCAEFCGVFHDRMLLVVRAVPRPEFEAWLAAQPRPSGGPSDAASSAPASGSP